jgi:hypothetical protein
MREKLNLSVDKWAAWSPTKCTPADWLATAAGLPIDEREQQPDLSMVPAIQRRRMSSLTKMAISTASACITEDDQQPLCVFASRHGELTRTVKILETLVKSEDVSPTDFSLSVHNTALGLYSILNKNSLAATTIAAGDDTFGFGLLEACNLMARHQAQSILFVYFDEPVPAPLEKLLKAPGETICVALKLNNRPDNSINFEFSANHNKSGNSTQNMGVAFLEFFLSEKRDWKYSTPRFNWRWQKS